METYLGKYLGRGCSHHADVAVTAAASFSNSEQPLPPFQGTSLPFLGILPLPFCCPRLVAVDTCCNCGKHLGGGGTLDLLLLPATSHRRAIKKDCLKTSLPLVIICQLRQSNNLSREHLFFSCRAIFPRVSELFQCSLLYSILLLTSVPNLLHSLPPRPLILSLCVRLHIPIPTNPDPENTGIAALHCIALPRVASPCLALYLITHIQNNTIQQPIYH